MSANFVTEDAGVPTEPAVKRRKPKPSDGADGGAQMQTRPITIIPAIIPSAPTGNSIPLTSPEAVVPTTEVSEAPPKRKRKSAAEKAAEKAANGEKEKKPRAKKPKVAKVTGYVSHACHSSVANRPLKERSLFK